MQMILIVCGFIWRYTSGILPLFSSNESAAGFPMSEYAKSLPHHRNMCKYESLEMGCHSISQYRQRLIGAYVVSTPFFCLTFLSDCLVFF